MPARDPGGARTRTRPAVGRSTLLRSNDPPLPPYPTTRPHPLDTPPVPPAPPPCQTNSSGRHRACAEAARRRRRVWGGGVGRTAGGGARGEVAPSAADVPGETTQRQRTKGGRRDCSARRPACAGCEVWARPCGRGAQCAADARPRAPTRGHRREAPRRAARPLLIGAAGAVAPAAADGGGAVWRRGWWQAAANRRPREGQRWRDNGGRGLPSPLLWQRHVTLSAGGTGGGGKRRRWVVPPSRAGGDGIQTAAAPRLSAVWPSGGPLAGSVVAGVGHTPQPVGCGLRSESEGSPLGAATARVSDGQRGISRRALAGPRGGGGGVGPHCPVAGDPVLCQEG